MFLSSFIFEKKEYADVFYALDKKNKHVALPKRSELMLARVNIRKGVNSPVTICFTGRLG